MTVLFFAILRDATQCEELNLETTEPLTGDELWARLLERFPDLEKHRGMTRLARNGAFAEKGALFHPGDEVALIPPVSGG